MASNSFSTEQKPVGSHKGIGFFVLLGVIVVVLLIVLFNCLRL